MSAEVRNTNTPLKIYSSTVPTKKVRVISKDLDRSPLQVSTKYNRMKSALKLHTNRRTSKLTKELCEGRAEYKHRLLISLYQSFLLFILTTHLSLLIYTQMQLEHNLLLQAMNDHIAALDKWECRVAEELANKLNAPSAAVPEPHVNQYGRALTMLTFVLAWWLFPAIGPAVAPLAIGGAASFGGGGGAAVAANLPSAASATATTSAVSGASTTVAQAVSAALDAANAAAAGGADAAAASIPTLDFAVNKLREVYDFVEIHLLSKKIIHAAAANFSKADAAEAAAAAARVGKPGAETAHSIAESMFGPTPVYSMPAESQFSVPDLDVPGAPEWTTLLIFIQAFIYLGAYGFALGGTLNPARFRSMMLRAGIPTLRALSTLAMRVLNTMLELHQVTRRNTTPPEQVRLRRGAIAPRGLEHTSVPTQLPRSFHRDYLRAPGQGLRPLPPDFTLAAALQRELFVARSALRAAMEQLAGTFPLVLPPRYLPFIGSVFAFIERLTQWRPALDIRAPVPERFTFEPLQDERWLAPAPPTTDSSSSGTSSKGPTPATAGVRTSVDRSAAPGSQASSANPAHLQTERAQTQRAVAKHAVADRRNSTEQDAQAASPSATAATLADILAPRRTNQRRAPLQLLRRVGLNSTSNVVPATPVQAEPTTAINNQLKNESDEVKKDVP